jgi:hypothetical protein
VPNSVVRRTRSGRVFWKIMTAVGVLLLMFVLWLAFFPGALLLLPEVLRVSDPAGLPAAIFARDS